MIDVPFAVFILLLAALLIAALVLDSRRRARVRLARRLPPLDEPAQ